MIDPVIFVLLVFSVFVVIGGVYAIFAVISNNRHNVETLEDANKRLIEMREDYQAQHTNNKR